MVAALLLSVMALAQTPKEIVSRMEEAMEKHEKEGLVMTMDIKIPILGTMSTKTYVLGDKYKSEGGMMGVKIVTWSDGTTTWTYDGKKDEITIEDTAHAKPDENKGDTEMFTGVADGYDVSLKKETDDAWYLLCKKSKDNTEKDDPKTMDLVVAKGTYYPVSISAKVSGVSVKIYDVSFGVSDKQVTFNKADYPRATIVDKRSSK
jgi:outer membrane lipoprotein-sorting protein